MNSLIYGPTEKNTYELVCCSFTCPRSYVLNFTFFSCRYNKLLYLFYMSSWIPYDLPVYINKIKTVVNKIIFFFLNSGNP